MVIYKNDIICKKQSDGILLPIGWTNNEHSYQSIHNYGFKECDMMKSYLENYLIDDVRDCICYDFCGMTLVWDYDKNNTNAANLRPFNLYLINDFTIVWTMKETVDWKNETCTGVRIISPDTFYFTTFACVGFTMKLLNGKIICIKQVFTR